MTTSDQAEQIHLFDNGIKVRKGHLIPKQIERYRQFNLHEPEEEELFESVLEQINPSGVVVDVGAAIGYYCILAKKKLPGIELHAFEPLLRFRQCLVDNAMLNGFTADTIVVHSEAIAARPGKAEFVNHDYGSSLVRDAWPVWKRLAGGLKSLLGWAETRKAATVLVETTTLDCFLERLQKRAELVKVDVQGFETDVLEGSRASMRGRLISRWLIGTHSADLHHRCLEMLRQHNYQIVTEQQQSLRQPDGIILARMPQQR
jgi:FkbM family methyltransferase